MKLKPFLYVICAIWISYAQHPDAGTTNFSFLDVAYDARSVALGDANVALPNGIYSVFSNPASLGPLKNKSVSLGYRPLFFDTYSTPVVFSIPVAATGIWAASLLYISGDKITETDIDVNFRPVPTTIQWGNYSVCGSVSWARSFLSNVYMGATFKGVYESFSSSAEESYSIDGFAVDVGAQYRLLKSRLIYGAVVRNLGYVRSFGSDNSDNFSFPARLGAGISYVPRNALAARLTLEIDKPLRDYLQGKGGVEIDLYNRVFFLRAGFCVASVDVEEFVNILQGVSTPDYQKNNADMFRLGLGGYVNNFAGSHTFGYDVACVFNVSGISPTILFNVLLEL